MEDPRDDVQFQILEHLRALRVEMADMRDRLDKLEIRLRTDEKRLGLAEKV
jgi:hypothetical protein